MRTNRTPRRGVTLIELLVAAALCMVIMAILASAFQTGTDTLSQLKSAGEMQEQLRVAAEKLRDDLKAPHFDDPALAGGKLSAVRYDLSAANNPNSGVFRLVQAGAGFQEAAVNSDPRYYSTVASPGGKVGYTTAGFNLPSHSAATGGNAHALQMAVKRDGKTRQRIFTAQRPATLPGKALDNKFDNLVSSGATYATRWAIVSYFLVDSGTKTGDGSPLFNLHRRVQLVAEEPGAVIPVQNVNFSTRPIGPGGTAPYQINTVSDLSVLAYRPAPFAPLGDGSDIVLSNVASFEIKANWDSTTYRKLPPTPPAGPTGGNGDVPNADYPFDDLPVVLPAPPGGPMTPIPPNTSSQYEATPRVFDTAANAIFSAEPLLGVQARYHSKVRILGVQIKIRIWDSKNSLARQVSVIQDL